MPLVLALIAISLPRSLRHAAAVAAGITTGITTLTIRPVRPVVFA
ncbi:threonine/homoserine/homoserine lactone efflux protein [Xanthomonas sacchari]|nr:threonine/homoserine/homoserine lactone efflux protein [Xanthomonas sp. F10]